MFRIGEFSRIARVSMRLLRYYDELGLLRPAHTDSNNGYRYYGAAQLSQLNRILVLRDLGLSLEQIERALQDGVSAQELRGMLLVRRSDIERTLAEQTQALRLVESRIAALEREDDSLPDDVVIREEPARRYLAVRRQYASFGDALVQALELMRELPRQLPRELCGRFIAVTHSPEFEPDQLDLELGYALEGEPSRVPHLPGSAKLVLRELSGHPRVATCVRVGPPDQAHLTTTRIGRWIELSGYRLAGPNREIFLKLPTVERAADAVVEMAFPIEPI